MLEQKQIQEIDTRKRDLRTRVSSGTDLTCWRFWDWMHHMAKDIKEPYTVSTF